MIGVRRPQRSHDGAEPTDAGRGDDDRQQPTPPAEHAGEAERRSRRSGRRRRPESSVIAAALPTDHRFVPCDREGSFGRDGHRERDGATRRERRAGCAPSGRVTTTASMPRRPGQPLEHEQVAVARPAEHRDDRRRRAPARARAAAGPTARSPRARPSATRDAGGRPGRAARRSSCAPRPGAGRARGSLTIDATASTASSNDARSCADERTSSSTSTGARRRLSSWRIISRWCRAVDFQCTRRRSSPGANSRSMRNSPVTSRRPTTRGSSESRSSPPPSGSDISSWTRGCTITSSSPAARHVRRRETERIADRRAQRTDLVAAPPFGRDAVRGACGRARRERREQEARVAAAAVERVGEREQGACRWLYLRSSSPAETTVRSTRPSTPTWSRRTTWRVACTSTVRVDVHTTAPSRATNAAVASTQSCSRPSRRPPASSPIAPPEQRPPPVGQHVLR